jgi:hypothetical protein
MKRTLATLGISLLVGFDSAHAQEDAGSAVSYCRHRTESSQLQDLSSGWSLGAARVELSEDRKTLCFDGRIYRNQEMIAFENLRLNGTFVMRSPGGNAGAAIEMANILRDKNAFVVLYDYCFSACANYILVASSRTYVTKNTIVAWHGGVSPFDCQYIDSGGFFDRHDSLIWREACKVGQLQRDFLRMRGTDDAITHAPQSHYTKKMLRLSAQLSGYTNRNVFWMWNPRYYGNRFKTQIIYESYPDTQDEVDDILRQHFSGSYVRVIYDP